MDILSYLSELIQTRKAVGIAGLGTVYKKKLPGRYDAELASFVPPSYTLDFTTEVKEETALADFIGQKRNVSTDTANYFINEFSSGILKQLQENGEVTLGDLGKLIKSEEELKFEPSASVNFGFDFFGLPPVKEEQETPAEEIIAELPDADAEVEAVQADEPTIDSVVEDNLAVEENPGDDPVIRHVLTDEAEQPAQVTTAPVVSAPSDVPAPVTEETDQDAVPAGSTNEQQLREEIESLNFYRSKSPYLKSRGPGDEEVVMKMNPITARENLRPEPPVIDPYPVYPSATMEEKTTPLYLKLLAALVVVAIIGVGAYFIKPELFNGILGRSNAPVTKAVIAPAPAVQSYPKEDSIPGADSIQKSGSARSPQDTLVTAARNTSPETMPADTATVYEIIGASMHDQKEADAFIALMKKSGIDAKVVTNMSGRRLKMSIATLKDEKSAKEELERLSKKLKIPGIYIYRNKQK